MIVELGAEVKRRTPRLKLLLPRMSDVLEVTLLPRLRDFTRLKQASRPRLFAEEAGESELLQQVTEYGLSDCKVGHQRDRKRTSSNR